MLTFALVASLSFADDTLPAYEELLPTVPSFQTARKRMYEIHEGGVTLYCGCPFTNKVPDLAACGLAGEGLRWTRTEAEHVVPASVIGATRPCWEEGGRDHCLDVDPVYKAAHNDLHNIYPAVGQLNAYRGSLAMGIIPEEPRVYGTCDFEIDEEINRVEPRPEVRGDIARVYFYMEWLYGIPLSEGQRRLFLHWHQTDPVDDAERALEERIQGQQGNRNPFVD